MEAYGTELIYRQEPQRKGKKEFIHQNSQTASNISRKEAKQRKSPPSRSTAARPRLRCGAAQLFDFYAAWLLMARRTLILLSLAPGCCILGRLQDVAAAARFRNWQGHWTPALGYYPESDFVILLVPFV